MIETSSTATDQVDELSLVTRELIRAVKALGDEGQTDLACRIAAEAWRVLRHARPVEAEKLNGALHYLTLRSSRQQKET